MEQETPSAIFSSSYFGVETHGEEGTARVGNTRRDITACLHRRTRCCRRTSATKIGSMAMYAGRLPPVIRVMSGVS
jgi:hypothetical protein